MIWNSSGPVRLTSGATPAGAGAGGALGGAFAASAESWAGGGGVAQPTIVAIDAAMASAARRRGEQFETGIMARPKGTNCRERGCIGADESYCSLAFHADA
jgi:hypothetical protein